MSGTPPPFRPWEFPRDMGGIPHGLLKEIEWYSKQELLKGVSGTPTGVPKELDGIPMAAPMGGIPWANPCEYYGSL